MFPNKHCFHIFYVQFTVVAFTSVLACFFLVFLNKVPDAMGQILDLKPVVTSLKKLFYK